jgi:hypothetical protein
MRKERQPFLHLAPTYVIFPGATPARAAPQPGGNPPSGQEPCRPAAGSARGHSPRRPLSSAAHARSGASHRERCPAVAHRWRRRPMIAHGAMAFNSPRAPKASPSSVPRILVLLESFDSRPAPDAHLKLSMIVRNDRRFFMYRPEKQKALLLQRLYTGIQPTETLLPEAVGEQLEPRVAGHYVWEGHLRANHLGGRLISHWSVISGWR